jgi:hypothetical protein
LNNWLFLRLSLFLAIIFRDNLGDYSIFMVYRMEIEQSVDYINLKRIFDERAQKVIVVPKVEKEKTEKQLENLRKKVLGFYLSTN